MAQRQRTFVLIIKVPACSTKRCAWNSKQPRFRRVVQAKRILTMAVAAGVWGLGLTSRAYADCAQDMQKLAQARNVELQKINEFAKSFHGKPMDPEQFCAKSTGLIHAEAALIARLEVGDGSEDATLETAVGQDGEKALDGVEPGSRSRREVEMSSVDGAPAIGARRDACGRRSPHPPDSIMISGVRAAIQLA
jgi:hypothetical protein